MELKKLLLGKAASPMSNQFLGTFVKGSPNVKLFDISRPRIIHITESAVVAFAFVESHCLQPFWIEAVVQSPAKLSGLVLEIFMHLFGILHLPYSLAKQRAYLFQWIAPTKSTVRGPQACSNAHKDADRALRSV